MDVYIQLSSVHCISICRTTAKVGKVKLAKRHYSSTTGQILVLLKAFWGKDVRSNLRKKGSRFDQERSSSLWAFLHVYSSIAARSGLSLLGVAVCVHVATCSLHLHVAVCVCM